MYITYDKMRIVLCSNTRLGSRGVRSEHHLGSRPIYFGLCTMDEFEVVMELSF